jgi:hypothetical protein
MFQKNNFIALFFICLFIFWGCKPKPAPVPVFNSNAIVDSVFNANWQSQTNFVCGQNGYALPFQNGKILWIYGNSHLNDLSNGEVPCTFTVNNAAVLQNGSSFTLLNNGLSDFIPKDENGKWYQPLSAFYYEDSIFIFCKKGTTIGNTYVAKLKYPSLQFLKMDSIKHNTTSTLTVQFGFANVTDTLRGYNYNYGIQNNIGANGKIASKLVLARYSLDSPQDTWEYYTNGIWQTNASKASLVASSADAITSIRKVRNGYIAIIQDVADGCKTGNVIRSSFAGEPWGPFNGDVTLFTIPETFQNFHPNAMGAVIQPYTFEATNRIRITYSLNGYQSCTNDCNSNKTNPAHYSTKAFTVPFVSLNPAW